MASTVSSHGIDSTSDDQPQHPEEEGERRHEEHKTEDSDDDETEAGFLADHRVMWMRDYTITALNCSAASWDQALAKPMYVNLIRSIIQ